MIRFHSLLVMAVLAATQMVPAAGATPLTAEVDVEPQVAVVGQAVRVTITVRGDAAMGARIDGSAPRGKLLTPAGNISSSSQFSWVNGRSESSRQFFLDYLATAAGEGEIPSFTLVGDGETFRTPKVSVKIRPASPGSAMPNTATPGPGVVVEGRLDRRSIYIGESVLLEYVLRARQAVRGIDPQRLGPVPKFVVEDIEFDPPTTQRRSADAQGRTWTEITVIRRRLMPTEAGALEIPAVPFQVGVEKRERDFFGFSMGGFFERVPVLAPALRLDVRPLPEEGRPADFSGAVGRFTLRAKLDRNRVKSGEAARLDFSVTGNGPLNTATAPHLTLPEGLAAFDPETKDEGTGRRTWSYPIVPEKAGKYEISGLAFSFFNPSTGQFERAQVPSLFLQADPSTGETIAPPASSRPGLAPPAGPTPEQDLAAVERTARGFYARVRSLVVSPRLWGGLLGMAALVAAGVLAWRRLPDWMASPTVQRTRRLRAIRKQLERLRHAPAPDPSETALQVLQAVFDGVELILGEPAHSLDRRRLETLVAAKTGDPGRARDLAAVLDQAEAVRFGGVPRPEDALRLVDEALRLL